MNARCIGVAFGCVFAILVIWGLSFDVRRWLEGRLWRRGEKRYVRLLNLAEPECDEFAQFADLCRLYASQAAELAALPEADSITLARRFL